jgi:hypothetical protein
MSTAFVLIITVACQGVFFLSLFFPFFAGAVYGAVCFKTRLGGGLRGATLASRPFLYIYLNFFMYIIIVCL